MNDQTDRLIEALAADARPVRRLAPPTLRAALWLIGFGVLAAAAMAIMADIGATVRRTSEFGQWLQVAGELGTGAAAVVAACHIALPDRSPRWAWLPVPFLALWLGSTGVGCLALIPTQGLAGPFFGHSPGCFGFMLAASLPTGALLFLLLRRARPLREKLTAVVAGLGVAAFSALLLRFVHPFQITVMDLAFHLAATLVVIGVASLVSGVALVGRSSRPV